MSTAFDFAAIEAGLVEAALDPTRWNEAMERAAKATGSFGALLFDVQGHLPILPRTRSVARAFDAYVRGGWIERDERFRLVPFLRARGVATDEDLMTSDDVARHPYFQEFLAPCGLRWCALIKIAAGGTFWSLSLQRSVEQGPFSPRELQQLVAFSHRAGSVAALATMLGLARAEAALDAFSASGMAAVMIGKDGVVLGMNGVAESLQARGLIVKGRHLASIDKGATERLNRALQTLLRDQSSVTSAPPVALPRTQGGPLIAYPVRLPHVSYNSLAPCQVIIILVDPDVQRQPPEIHLQATFHLTGAEARLASMMSTGEPLETVADRCRISYQTARNELKAVFSKTGTHRQAELVSLLTRLLPKQ
ncbi:helix-turn-helix transcriptional regulator [Mesorhizobium sp.]|uniref:helix-turn-helix transcriptional regulator n=1 Tax=Mesorhizobium sp. TaxID=1871066 RepID=UPI000FEA30D7|nr:helix-turn-helix transcriptional regulator [Mesorhizobium sp.]RWA69390.1 MAG: helix-turn-helix transcriptional regulator [Mesorhizobium sp.]RWA77148.1 MAG: helix-turn-helix transcriptional regulator [Mesorhizobium sp.]